MSGPTASTTSKPTKPLISIPPSPPPSSESPMTGLESVSTPSRSSAAGAKYSHARHRSIDIDELKNRVQGSPVARRMSMSSTPQGRSDFGGGGGAIRDLVLKGLKREGVIVGGLCAASLITGIILSLFYRTALSTSISSTPLSKAYLAQKSNFLNAYLVKLSWLHTTVIYLVHLFTSPPSVAKFPRLATYILATAFWAAFTNWFFGAGLGDRIIELSGGACALIIPPASSLASAGLAANLDMINKILPGSSIIETGEGTLLHLPSTFCTLRKPLTETSHPELFDLLSSSLSDAARSTSDSAAATMSPKLSALIPRWRKGFDISGHAFLLTLAAILLSRELAPTWRRWVASTSSGGPMSLPSGFGGRRKSMGLMNTLHFISGVLGTVLVMIWVGMLGVTGMYFHDPPEKLSGLPGALLNLAPSSPFTTPQPTRSTSLGLEGLGSSSDSPGKTAYNENRARRGDIVDEGVVNSPFMEDDEVVGNEDIRSRRSVQGGEAVLSSNGGMSSAGGVSSGRDKAE